MFPGDPAFGKGTAFLTACLNGGTSRDEHPAVPFSPEELAAEARSAAAFGARAIHVHPRSASGAQSLEPSDVLPAVAAIRAATGLPVGVTTGIWTVSGNTARRLALVAGWTGPDKPDFASINVNEPGIDALADLLIESLGIPVEAGVWTVADVGLLAGSTLAPRAFQVLLEPTSRVASEAVAVASAASVALLERGIAVPQVHHGYGLATWQVIRWAAGAGFGVRVGLEDTTVLPDGTVAAGNGDLVAAAMRVAAEAGR
ncbi:MAG: hypothetical protein JWM19_4061 [Actinomycetia bacterium]|nr:hypothetical protein [Actinomycetes bacterium]